MNEFIALDNIEAVIAGQQLIPTVVMWNRLEGRPRRKDFDRALRAEIRDALWMITRQWQVGEFRGDDAGSPVHARLLSRVEELGWYRPADGTARPFDHDLPLESTVEQRNVPLATREHLLSLDLRLLMGRQWLKMLASVGDFRDAYIERYPIRRPDPTLREDAPFCAHVEVWQHFSALAGRAMDGGALYLYLKADPTRNAWDGITVPETDKDDIDGVAERFVDWFDALFVQPADDEVDAWVPEQLEYRFDLATAAAEPRVLAAEEYYHGRLDWFNLDIDPEAAPPEGDGGGDGSDAGDGGDAVRDVHRGFIPTTLTFDGMPHTRWWSFEDGRTNFGDVSPDTTDLGKLLLMEFGLVYANDWFLVPLTVPTGTVLTVRGLAVSNVFGERTWVEPAGRGPDDAWQTWRMFQLSTRGEDGDVPADTGLLMLPTAAKVLEQRPTEEFALIRDEVANMVWAIEDMVPLPTGAAKRGREAALETRAYLERIVRAEAAAAPPVPAPPAAAPLRYELMTSVPEHWIPFIPVHVDGDNREIQLQRASMPRAIEGDPQPPAKVKPRTVLVRHGLDRTPAEPYFMYEEGVTRAGVRVRQSFQRTRWYGGAVVNWLGIRKITGRGEGSSGLAFDQLRPTDAV